MVLFYHHFFAVDDVETLRGLSHANTLQVVVNVVLVKCLMHKSCAGIGRQQHAQALAKGRFDSVQKRSEN